MGTVKNIPVTISAEPLTNTDVKITLISGTSSGLIGGKTVIKSIRVRTAGDGTGWQAELIPNPDLLPANTCYEVIEYAGGDEFAKHFFVLPDDSEYNLVDLLVIPENLPGYTYLTLPPVVFPDDENKVLTAHATGSNWDAPTGGGGGPSGVGDSRLNLTGNVEIALPSGFNEYLTWQVASQAGTDFTLDPDNLRTIHCNVAMTISMVASLGIGGTGAVYLQLHPVNVAGKIAGSNFGENLGWVGGSYNATNDRPFLWRVAAGAHFDFQMQLWGQSSDYLLQPNQRTLDIVRVA